MIYVASPYSTPLKGPAAEAAMESRYLKVREFISWIMITKGPPAFSPIVYCHPIAVANRGQIGSDAAYWHNFNMDFLRRAEAVFVLMLPGWETSKGVKIELQTAQVLKMPVSYFNTEFKEVVMQ